MPLIVIGSGSNDIKDGTYEMILISIVPKTIIPRSGDRVGQEVEVLEWTFGDVEDDTIEVSGISSTTFTPKSKTVQWITALLGPDAAKIGNAFEEKDLIGRRALVTTKTDDNGWAKIDGVTAMPTKRSRTPRETAEIMAAVVDEPTEGTQDDLPF